MNKIIIKDDFLNKDIFENIKNKIFDCHENNLFPWYLQDFKGKKGDQQIQLTHVFFNKEGVNSKYFDNLKPILEKLKIKMLLRIKANVTFKTNEIRIYKYHTDFETSGRTSIFYLHTTNGPTVFKDGQKVDCVENRMLTFPTNMLHSGSTHTDSLLRGVINFNWVKV